MGRPNGRFRSILIYRPGGNLEEPEGVGRMMTLMHPKLALLRTALILAAPLALVAVVPGCIPYIPDCDCSNDSGGTEGVVVGEWPDLEFLDRSQPCILDDSMECGYPAPDGDGYSYTQGDVIENWVFSNCAGEQIEMAEFLNTRMDTGELNRGVVIGLGAGWCQPCQLEGQHFAEIAPAYREQGIEFMQILLEGNQNGSTAQASLCEDWVDQVAQGNFNVLYDPDHTQELKDNPWIPPEAQGGIPFVFVIDANGNIRFKEGPLEVDPAVLDAEIQKVIDDPYGL